MKFWVVGEFHDGTSRLVGAPNGFADHSTADTRLNEVLGQQSKPHHVEYEVVEATSLKEIERQGILLMGYP